MLVLQRKIGEKILIGDEIEVTIVDISGDKVRVAIDAPRHISVLRSELKDAALTNKEAALSVLPSSGIPRLFSKKRKED